MTALKRSSKSPRNRVPASRPPVSSAKISAPFSASWHIVGSSSRAASPSAMAVLPTPASPTNTGLFLRRRQRTSIVRWSSSVRPISGSRSPCRARSVRFEQYAASGSRAVADPSSPPPAAARCCRRIAAGRRAAFSRSRATMYSSTSSRVTPCAASSCAACALRLLQDRREDVAGLRLRRAVRSGRAAPRSAGRGGTRPSARARVRSPRFGARSTRRDRRRARGAARAGPCRRRRGSARRR